MFLSKIKRSPEMEKKNIHREWNLPSLKDRACGNGSVDRMDVSTSAQTSRHQRWRRPISHSEKLEN